MSQEIFDFVIPLYRIRWNTRAVLEGISSHYQPRAIHVIAPAPEAKSLAKISQSWQTVPLYSHEEETFFQTVGLTKDTICAELDLQESLYTPGWFYQQLLKLGAFEGIDNLSEWYVVWDSDLLPVDTWQLIQKDGDTIKHSFALLQHNNWGNPSIVSKWDKWINSILEVKSIADDEGTFIPHHIWFKQQHLKSFAGKVSQYYKSDDHWLRLMMRSANDFGTFSEYWSYVSWVAAQAPNDLSFYPYKQYGATTERFFDDGTGLFSAALGEMLAEPLSDNRFPTYTEIDSFIRAEYKPDELPSSLSFESSPRHLKKNEENMHIEELRSRWNPRNVEVSDVDSQDNLTVTT
ncbi:conserved hypothetical protein [Hyella patelloides LEGE 07179]|uniref:Uncharacterized protein n=1 Tax=Hyella patelloides LEGE 07179 TaxID=945734 RepID=A0A563VV21_9CYAN|nr:DUF6492 family protein [Hyella patelloides]VEP15282.1 conserved hypothetical protein [Hyella patelloides LEGE 07179]